MYELRRLSEVWPTLRGSQSLKSLLHDHYAFRADTNLNVWVHPGHVIVSHGQTVLSFDVLPRSKHLIDSAGSALYSSENRDPAWLCLTDCTAPLVHVFCPGEDHNVAGLVFGDGKVEFWRFQRPEYKWTAANFIHLMTTEPMLGHQRMAISSVAWLEDRRSLLVCYSTPRSFSSGSVVGEKPASNRFSVGEWLLNASFETVVSYHSVLVQCPVMSFTSCRGMVCCRPRDVTLTGIVLLWITGRLVIQPHFCRSQQNHLLPEVACPANFTDVATRIVGLWLTEKDPPQILSVAAYRWTNEILVLLQDGQVLVGRFRKGRVSFSLLVTLKPWSCSDAEGTSKDQVSDGGGTQLLAQRSCLVLAQPDSPLRLFDVHSGQQVWHSIDMQLADSHTACLWQFPTAASAVGTWSRSGLWMLWSKPVLAQAESLMIFSNVSDIPEEDAVVKCCRAARLCLDWNQHAAAVRFSLQGASMVDKTSGKDGETHQDVPKELVQLLDVTGLESPALLLPALVKFPAQRQHLIDKITFYLKRYKTDSDISARLLRSSLGEDIVPLLEDFLSLAQQYTELLTSSQPALPPSNAGDVRCEVLRLVDSQSTVSGSVEASQARLDLLAENAPELVLSTLRDFLDIANFNEALSSAREEMLQSTINWESVLVRDNAFLQSAETLVAARFPLFELLCRLLYNISPKELVAFVEFSSVVLQGEDEVDAAFVQHNKEHYFVQRALAALPVQLSDTPPQSPASPSTNTSSSAVVAHAQLLMKSAQPQCGLMAIRHLVSHRLWADVFELVKLIVSEDTEQAQSMEVFHTILVSLIECNQLHLHWQAVMKLRPASFSLAYFLSILQMYVAAPAKSQVDSSGFLVSDPNGPLTVDVIRGMLLSMT